MKRILFQGDSITDAGRDGESSFDMGFGYPTLVSGRIGYDNPGEYEFLNRGIGGNRVVDLLARIKRDIINLKPDIMSILIGVNDVWHEIMNKNGVSAERFELIYDMIISDVLRELPNIKIMILEPFVLKNIGEDYDYFHEEVKKRAAAAKRIAEKYNLVFVSLADKFEEMSKLAPESTWTLEGVHPTSAGHELIARRWVEGFEKLNKV